MLKPGNKLSSALHRLPINADGGVRSFNHTRSSPIIDKPIVVSIETKADGGNIKDAEVQLAVWAAAHLSRLQELLHERHGQGMPLPWLPLLLFDGPRWSFLFASRAKDGTTVSLLLSVSTTMVAKLLQNIWSRIEFGDTSTRLGIFKVTSVIVLLFDWAEQHYRPWFEANAISQYLP